MGMYPIFTTLPADRDYVSAWEEFRREPGVVYKRVVTASEWVEFSRDDCYCCSCVVDPYFTADPCCRNHGWDGERPCEVHGMPGTAGDDGVMPVSVQIRLAARSG